MLDRRRLAPAERLWRDPPRNLSPDVILPVRPRLRGGTCEHPEPNALPRQSNDVSERVYRLKRRNAHSFAAVDEMLRRVICRISNERLWIDGEPLNALATQNVPCMQVREENDLPRSSRSGVPGMQRSNNIASSVSSASRSRTVPCPSQNRRPAISCAPI